MAGKKIENEEPSELLQSFVATRVVNMLRTGETSDPGGAMDKVIQNNPTYDGFDWDPVRNKILSQIETRILSSDQKAETRAVKAGKKGKRPSTEPLEEEKITMDDLLNDPDIVHPKAVVAKGRKSIFKGPSVKSVEESEGKLWRPEGAKKAGADCPTGSKGFKVEIEGKPVIGCRKTNSKL